MEKLIKKAYIYKLTNKESGKSYVGQTTQDPKRRWRSSTGNTHGYRGTTPIAKAITSKGWTMFSKEILEVLEDVTQDRINEKEAYYMEVHNCLDKKTGYNCKSYGEGGKEFYTEEVKQRMSEIKLGVSVDSPAWNRGESKTNPDGKEIFKCAKCEEWLTSDKFSPINYKTQTGKEYPRKVNYWCKSCNAENTRNNRKKNPPKKLSKEEFQKTYETRKEAMSAGAKAAYAKDPTLKQRASKARSKPIVAKDPVTGEIVHRFDSGLAAKEAGFNNVTVSEAIKKGIVRLGYRWEKA